MTAKTSFNEEEWFLVSSLPSMIGAAVATTGKSGLIGTMKEMMASARAMMEAGETYADNELIQAIVAKMDNKDDAKAQAEKYQQMAMEKMEAAGVKTPEQLAQLVLDDCQTVMDLLNDRATAAETADYQAWALSVGTKVAEAAKEGGFLGFGGEQVSEGEEALLQRIAATLNQ
ncbi:MAG: hypothetical protein H6668_09865 [Ardenticatenaceae bacterium]|nr:hypothetical protein [Ardenticatenaceae bacterium]